MKDAILSLFWQNLFPAILSALGAGLVWLCVQLSLWVSAHTGGTKLGQFLVKLTAMANSVVAHVEAELRPKLASAMADGQLTAEEGAQLKAEAMRLLKEALGEQGMGDMKGLMGLAGSAVEVLLSGVVEGALTRMKAQAALQSTQGGVLPAPLG